MTIGVGVSFTTPQGNTYTPTKVIHFSHNTSLAADNAQSGKRYFVKVFARDLSAERSREELFERERRALEILGTSHQAIVPPIESFVHEGIGVLIFPFHDTITLEDLVYERTRSSPQYVSQVLSEVASALTYAYERKVHNLDTKSRNIGITGTVRLFDWEFSDVPGMRLLDAEGNIAGTVPFTAPERLKVEGCDLRSDVYSLAVIAYEAMLGSTIAEQYGREDDEFVRDLLKKRIRPTPLHHLTDVSSRVALVVQQGMALNPNHRQQTPLEFVEDLNRALKPRVFLSLF